MLDSFSTHRGKNCLRDILGVTSHPELLPTAFELTALPGKNDAAKGSAASAAAAAAGSSGSVRGNSEFQRSPMGGNNAVVAAAAAVPLDSDDEADSCCTDFDMDYDLSEDDDEELNNNNMDNLGDDTEGENEDDYRESGAADSNQQRSAGPMFTKSRAGQLPDNPYLAALTKSDVTVANIQQLTFKKLETLFPRSVCRLFEQPIKPCSAHEVG